MRPVGKQAVLQLPRVINEPDKEASAARYGAG